MELIIKPTLKCNFACKFCSANSIHDGYHPINKVPNVLKEYIEKLNPSGLIITGGDPLMVSPDYYYDLHEINKSNISATTNLKSFYLNPTLWAPLLNEKWFKITTSFNYGNTRMWDENTIYTEEMFLKVIDKFKEYVNYTPSFIAVIDNNNYDIAINHVLLAQRINSVVKLNGAIGCGKQQYGFPRYKMFQLYIKIMEMKLGRYESNCRDRKIIRCPNDHFYCRSSIRCCYVDINQKLHVSICDEQLSMGNELPKNEYICKSYYKENISYNDYINEKCLYCELFNLCNGCRTLREESKLIPEHCDEMKKLIDNLIKYEWKL